MSSCSFIVVKYGKDQEKLFNTNCKVINLLHCIRETCGCSDAEIDLAEEATGIVQFLPSNLHERTSSLLPTPKTTYVLVRIQKGEDGSMEYVPMMDMGRSNFLVKLKSTRTKIDSIRKRGTDKKMKEDGRESANDTPTLAAPASSTFSSNNSTIPSTTATTIPPSSSSTSTMVNPASPASTPTKGKSATARVEKSPKKAMFPKIDGSDAAHAPAQGGDDDDTLSPTKKTHKRPGSMLLEPVT